MKILITGATGLVGKALGTELVRRGHTIAIISRRRQEALEESPFPCEVIEGNLTEGPLQSSALSSIDGVIHLMGESIAKGFWTTQKKEKLVRSRVDATRNLIQSFQNNKPKVFISASAIGIYGDRDDESLAENSAVGRDFLSHLCQNWEEEALKIQSPETRVAMARIGLVLARQGGLLKEILPLFQYGLGGALGHGRQWMSWIHLQDLVRIFIFALENQYVTGPFNAVAPNPVRNKDFTAKLGEKLHRPTLFKVPKMALQLALQEKSTIVTSSQNCHPIALLNWGFQFQYNSLEKALDEELGPQSQGEEVFETQQYIPLKPIAVFPFFAEAKNLETITPQQLHFKIDSVSTSEIQEGTLIDYTLKIRGLPVHWRTEIVDWHPPHQFVDNQLKGPYALWHHSHRFEALGDGTLMSDRVRFRLPLGFLGWSLGIWFVRMEVASIFQFRRKKIRNIFKF